MVFFGQNGFIRKQEVACAKRLLVLKYENSGVVLPDESVLFAYADKVVDDAHNIAKESGSNILEILKNTIKQSKLRG